MRRVLDCDEHITAATSSADAEASKPHPDLIGAALEAARLQPTGSVFVGDAVWDVEAAGRADAGCSANENSRMLARSPPTRTHVISSPTSATVRSRT
jgi:phosphoglycolate phosphatase-like HAD superfamily hydrolase